MILPSFTPRTRARAILCQNFG